MSGWTFYVQAIIAVVLLVDPFIRSVFFRMLTEDEPQNRKKYVFKIMWVVGILLAVSAVAGREILELIGINLDAFGIVGGFVLVVMGLEMLWGGEESRAQGGKKASEEPTDEDRSSVADKIVVPYAIPFMAGPGAITTVITISASGEGWDGPIAALIAVGVTVALIPVGHLLLVNRMNWSKNTMTLLTKFGGIFVATIGTQLMLGGIKGYFGI